MHSHWSDEDDNPAGGESHGIGFSIDWQDGPLKGGQPTGAFVEDVISACIERIRFYQESKFKCRENALALTKLEEALHWLDHRTADRERRKVEGTHQL